MEACDHEFLVKNYNSVIEDKTIKITGGISFCKKCGIEGEDINGTYSIETGIKYESKSKKRDRPSIYVEPVE